MKHILTVLFLLLTGCAADPERLNTISAEEASRLAKPSMPLSAFPSYELKPFVLSEEVKRDARKVKVANILEKKLQAKLLPLFAQWSSSGGGERAGTLIVQPELVELRMVSGGARLWVGALAGGSNVELDLELIDGNTNTVIAKPRINREVDAMTGALPFSRGDKDMLDYTVHIADQYLSMNY